MADKKKKTAKETLATGIARRRKARQKEIERKIKDREAVADENVRKALVNEALKTVRDRKKAAAKKKAKKKKK